MVREYFEIIIAKLGKITWYLCFCKKWEPCFKKSYKWIHFSMLNSVGRFLRCDFLWGKITYAQRLYNMRSGKQIKFWFRFPTILIIKILSHSKINYILIYIWSVSTWHYFGSIFLTQYKDNIIITHMNICLWLAFLCMFPQAKI